MIDIRGLNKAEVLKALYDGSRVQGIGFLEALSRDESIPAIIEGRVTVEHCQQLLDATGYPYFDYLYGRVLKVDLSKDEFEERLYDANNGQGAAERVIRRLRNSNTNAPKTGICRLDLTRLKIEFASDAGREFPHSIMIRFGDIRSVNAMIAALEDTRAAMEGGVQK
ncbi:MAG: hypothetical protein IJZ39_07090 [Oscillospiraceae bacterium]|nr:hypothetical protein [Oscillospiraceae bacterium]